MKGYRATTSSSRSGWIVSGYTRRKLRFKIGAHPMDQAKISEKRFYKQLEAIGNGFAWNEQVETAIPNYYRWTQWVFTEMWRHSPGLSEETIRELVARRARPSGQRASYCRKMRKMLPTVIKRIWNSGFPGLPNTWKNSR